MDDRRQRHLAPGDAEGRREGTHARVSIVGEPACFVEDDGPALSGHPGDRDSRGYGRRRNEGADYLRRVLGQASWSQ